MKMFNETTRLSRDGKVGKKHQFLKLSYLLRFVGNCLIGSKTGVMFMSFVSI